MPGMLLNAICCLREVIGKSFLQPVVYCHEWNKTFDEATLNYSQMLFDTASGIPGKCSNRIITVCTMPGI